MLLVTVNYMAEKDRIKKGAVFLSPYQRKEPHMSTQTNSYTPWYADEYAEQSRTGIDGDYLDLSPQDIKKGLEETVVDQAEACRKVAIMMYHHLQGRRFVSLLAGPTGSGKSFIAESLKRMFPDVVYMRDVSNVTQDGWKGDKKVGTLFQRISAVSVRDRVIHPVMFLDECDKLFTPKFTSSGENVSESVQSEFLTIIQGSRITLTEKKQNGTIMQEVSRDLDTSCMSFLFAGAFAKRANAVADKKSGSSFGFGNTFETVRAYETALTMKDVMEAGCISELCGRINSIVCLNSFGESGFRNMLDCNSRGPVYEMEKEFGISIHISDRKKDELAHDAFESGLGVRGMKNAIREYIDELTWEDCNAKVLDID